MKKNLLISLLLVTSTLLMATNELVIQVKTDKYSSETSWKLYDLENNIIAENGILGKDSTHYDTLMLDETVCYYWTIYDAHGDGFSHSTTAGDYQIFLNGDNIAACEDPNYGDSISVYGIGTSCAMYDIAIDELTFSSEQAFNAFGLTLNVFNYGTEFVNSIELIYSIDGVDSEPFLFENLDLEFGLRTAVTFPEQIQILEPGDYTIGVKVLMVNGEEDEFTPNNYLEKIISVADGYFQKPMHEEFTANWCSPCAAANPLLDAVLEQYPGQYSIIKYQYVNDTYYHPHGGQMANFYGVPGVPAMYVNKVNTYPGTYTEEDFESYIGIITQVDLTFDVHAIADSIYATITINASKDYTKDMFLRLAVVENTTIGNVGTNGEEAFYKVFMRFLSNVDGDNLGTLNKGEELIVNYIGSMDKTHVEEMNDLSLVGYLFTEDSYDIHQSEMMEIPVLPSITFNVATDSMNVDLNQEIVITSSEKLFNTDGSEIEDIHNVVGFTMESIDGSPVDFDGSISDDGKIITIQSTSALEMDTRYSVNLFNVSNAEGTQLTDIIISFTTIGENTSIVLNNTTIGLYPNPAKNLITVALNKPSSITVIDAAGKQLINMENASNLQKIHINHLDKGVYFVVIHDNEKMTTLKFIKQ